MSLMAFREVVIRSSKGSTPKEGDGYHFKAECPGVISGWGITGGHAAGGKGAPLLPADFAFSGKLHTVLVSPPVEKNPNLRVASED